MVSGKIVRRRRQGFDGVLDLARGGEGDSARRQDADQRRPAEHVVDEQRTRADEVLTVVQDDQQLFFPQLPDQPVQDRDIRPVRDSEHLSDRARHRPGVGVRGEIDEPDATRPRTDLVGGGLEGEAGLAGATDPGQRDEPVAPQEPCDVRQLSLATDEGGQLRRQVVSPSGGRSTSHLVA